MTTPIQLELYARPLQLSMSQRADFMIGVRVRNLGREVMDPRLDLAELTVNGEVSMDWRSAIGNGGREPAWHALPPGRQVGLDWPLGEFLFDNPGEFTLELRLGEVAAQPVQVVVTP